MKWKINVGLHSHHSTLVVKHIQALLWCLHVCIYPEVYTCARIPSNPATPKESVCLNSGVNLYYNGLFQVALI